LNAPAPTDGSPQGFCEQPRPARSQERARPTPTRAQLALHDIAVREARPGYRDHASGLTVLTAPFLLAQGACCNRGCRHCPFAPPAPDAGAAAV